MQKERARCSRFIYREGDLVIRRATLKKLFVLLAQFFASLLRARPNAASFFPRSSLFRARILSGTSSYRVLIVRPMG